MWGKRRATYGLYHWESREIVAFVWGKRDLKTEEADKRALDKL
jgi:hypothetical protein